jgi:ribosomal protein S18 acetylase RimI-like enzyme
MRSRAAPRQIRKPAHARVHGSEDTHAVRVAALTDELLEEAVRIHLAGLGYTMNSRLGRGHLRFLYRLMARDDRCYVGLALSDGRPVGIISGTLDAGSLSTRLWRAMSFSRLARIAFTFLSQPSLIFELWKSRVIAAPVFDKGREVKAILTTLSVDPGVQARGIGRRLVAAMENSFARRGIRMYRVDTLLENLPAREFYRKLGFREVGERADSMVFLKAIAA